MKTYCIETKSTRVDMSYVQAESEEDARAKAGKLLDHSALVFVYSQGEYMDEHVSAVHDMTELIDGQDYKEERDNADENATALEEITDDEEVADDFIKNSEATNL